MRFSIGHRLFVSVLLAILAVAVTAIALMRQNVMNSFGDYAVSIELDRLDQLSGVLAARHQKNKGWTFIPATGRKPWIASELARLQQQRLAPLAPLASVAPVAPVAPAPPVAPAMPEPPVPPAPAELPEPTASPASPASPRSPASPPSPPSPALAPLPPPAVPPIPEPPPDFAAVDELGLQDRVTLLDAAGEYLAGRVSEGEPSVHRAIEVGGQAIGYLVVARATRPSDAMSASFVYQLKQSLLVIVAASIALSALAAVLLAAHFRKPILRLADGARALADGHYATRLTETRSDELGDLAHSFNQLAEKLDQVEASRRQWVADTSHELRTPLSVLRAQLEAIQDGVRPASAEGTAAMLRQVLSLNKLIDQLYALARADVGQLDDQRQHVDVWQLVSEQADAFGEKFAAVRMSIDLGAAPDSCHVHADPDRLRQLLSNIFENCIRYCGNGARIEAHARQAGNDIEILVDDNGPGVPKAALPHLADRFYRVDGSRSREHGGAGLGLALCHRIVTNYGGQLLFARSPLGGLQVLVRLPLAST